jgi:hypothetical protein
LNEKLVLAAIFAVAVGILGGVFTCSTAGVVGTTLAARAVLWRGRWGAIILRLLRFF